DRNGVEDVFVRDRMLGTTERVSVDANGVQGNGDSRAPSMSAGGRYVAFCGAASNLVPGDVNSLWDAFVHDRQTGATELVNVATSGTYGDLGGDIAALSADGRYVAFTSGSSNLVAGDVNGKWDVFLRDRQAGTTVLV